MKRWIILDQPLTKASSDPVVEISCGPTKTEPKCHFDKTTGNVAGPRYIITDKDLR